jgi:hypothetical protein
MNLIDTRVIFANVIRETGACAMVRSPFNFKLRGLQQKWKTIGSRLATGRTGPRLKMIGEQREQDILNGQAHPQTSAQGQVCT